MFGTVIVVRHADLSLELKETLLSILKSWVSLKSAGLLSRPLPVSSLVGVGSEVWALVWHMVYDIMGIQRFQIRRPH